MGLPVRIEMVVEAYALLQDLPAASRNGAHVVALNACKAVLASEIDAETGRATFLAFAHRNDILLAEAASLPLSNDARPILPASSGMRAWL